jgi:hypothetical protein
MYYYRNGILPSQKSKVNIDLIDIYFGISKIQESYGAFAFLVLILK